MYHLSLDDAPLAGNRFYVWEAVPFADCRVNYYRSFAVLFLQFMARGFIARIKAPFGCCTYNAWGIMGDIRTGCGCVFVGFSALYAVECFYKNRLDVGFMRMRSISVFNDGDERG